MGSEDDSVGTKTRITKQSDQRVGGGSIGGGLVAGIATVVVVGVGGKLLSKMKKLNKDSSAAVTATDPVAGIRDRDARFCSTILKAVVSSEGHPESVPVSECRNLPSNEDIISEEKAGSPNLQEEESVHDDTCTRTGNDHTNCVCSDASAESTADDEHTDSSFIEQQSKLIALSTASTALSELVTNALLDATQESPSKHDLMIKTKALQNGIAEAISRAFDDFSRGGDISSDELTPTKLGSSESWETFSSGSEVEAVGPVIADPVSEAVCGGTGIELRDMSEHREEAVSGPEQLSPPGYSSTDNDDRVVERIKYDAPASEVEVSSFPRQCSSAPSPESSSQSITAKTEQSPAVSALATSLSAKEQGLATEDSLTPSIQPKSTGVCEKQPAAFADRCSSEETQNGSREEKPIAEIKQDNIESESLVALEDKIKELLNDITTLHQVTNESRSDEKIKKETASQDDAQVTSGSEVGVSVKVTSTLQPSKDGVSTEVTVTRDVDIANSTEIPTLTAKNAGTPVTVTSFVLPASSDSYQVRNITKIVGEESKNASSPNAAIVTTVELTSSKAEGSTREGVRNRLPVEVLGLAVAVLVALVAFIVLATRTRFNRSMPVL